VIVPPKTPPQIFPGGIEAYDEHVNPE